MHPDVDDGADQTAMLERLRLQAARLSELDRKIAVLERRNAELKCSRDQLVEQLAHYREIKAEWEWFFENSVDMLCVTDAAGRLMSVNNALVQSLGYGREELISKSFGTLVHPEDLEKARAELQRISVGNDSTDFEVRCLHKNGEWRWISWTCPATTASVKNLYSIGRDVTDSKLTEAELLFRAQHDPLTRLANRAMFDQVLAQAIARTERNPASQVALLVIDLDGFKEINDRRGHAAGDAVLKTLAHRFTGHQRKGDLVCRIGGDEFAWVVESGSSILLEPLAERIIELVHQPIQFGDLTLEVGCSIGASICPEQAKDAETLFNQADAAMYTVKRTGKNGFVLYRPSL
jgi:diguanylate cyclase (GGDEF)-like protein/PAS domain S-box-containing protein